MYLSQLGPAIFKECNARFELASDGLQPPDLPFVQLHLSDPGEIQTHNPYRQHCLRVLCISVPSLGLIVVKVSYDLTPLILQNSASTKLASLPIIAREIGIEPT